VIRPLTVAAAARIACAAACVICAGCNEFAGNHEAVLDPCALAAERCEETSAGSTTGQGGQGGQGASAASSAATTTSVSGAAVTSVNASTGASTASGTNAWVCGDGIINPGEECDDHNATPNDGCTGCIVDCVGPGAFKDPALHHCYGLVTIKLDFAQANAVCKLAGAHLAAVTTSAELALVAPHLDKKAATWIGGSDSAKEGTFTWTDGEPWSYAPWVPGAPSMSPTSDCVAIDGAKGGFDDQDCNKKLVALCERGPAGAPP